jgi:1,4-alpha-glucan branching enzyme
LPTAARNGSPQKTDTSQLADAYRSASGLPRGGAYRDFVRPGTSTFFLTAPYKPVVHLVGDFNNWDPKATLMESDGCGLFQATLPVHGRARYEFLIMMDRTGQQVYAADPYAREIDWDDHGRKAVVADDAPYQWHDRSWQRPSRKDLIIYELCVRDFSRTDMPTVGGAQIGIIIRPIRWPTCRTSFASGSTNITWTASVSIGWEASSMIRGNPCEKTSTSSTASRPSRAARAAVPDCYLIGEYWPINGTNQAKTAARLIQETEIDAVWNGTFHHVLENCLLQTWQWERQDVWRAWGSSCSQGFARADQLVNYVVSHDEPRPEHELQYYAQHVRMEDTSGQVPPAGRWELGMQKARLGLALLVTAPGVPMLFAGQEFGADSPRAIDFWPLDGSKLEDPAGRAQLAFYQRLLALRRAHPALRSDHIEFYMDDFACYKMLRYKRWSEDGDVVVVALNFDCVPQPVGLGFPGNGDWEDAVSGQRVQVTKNWHDFVLPAWSSLILTPVA